MNKNLLLVLATAIIGLVCNSNATIYKIQQDGLWSDAGIWSGGNIASSASDTDSVRVVNGATATLDYSTGAGGLLFGDHNVADSSGHFVITNGATLTLAEGAGQGRSILIAWSSTGQSGGISMYDNSVINASGRVFVGGNTGATSAYMNIYNSTLTAGDFISVGQASGVNSTLLIDGGTVHSVGMQVNATASIVMNNGATWTVEGNYVNYYNNRMDQFTGVQSVELVDGNTVIKAIPEPATLGLVAAFGGAILFMRRRFML